MLHECYIKRDDLSESETLNVSTLKLDYLHRSRSRGRAKDSQDEDVAWFLDRGGVIADGEILQSREGRLIKILAADESVSEIHAEPEALIHAAYHLGNRHLPLQIGQGWLRYQQDHVIDAMIASFKLDVQHVDAPFDPESGAYHSANKKSAHEHHHHD
jgi:urease accessory protein